MQIAVHVLSGRFIKAVNINYSFNSILCTVRIKEIVLHMKISTLLYMYSIHQDILEISMDTNVNAFIVWFSCCI